MSTLETLHFDNTYARLPPDFYRRVEPTPLPAPYLVSFNKAAANLIGLDPQEATRAEFAEYFSGNKLLPGSEPVSAIYAGHQFGTYVPQLGDGRAILLGEVTNTRGEHGRDELGRDEHERGKRWDVQLKGAGLTPFSRMGDGRAVLRSTIREYLCSEAMHALGIPTTRSLCIVGSDEPVFRETVESAAVLTRLAETHVRFGTFELFYHRRQNERVRELADYVVRNHYAHLTEAKDKYLQFLREVINRTARLIAQWQAIGFAHGVMNTDNMSVIGLTIDYGPFGFLDEFDAGFICNHSDYGGRYAFDQQPNIALWNLSCFAQTLLPLMSRDEAIAALNEYQSIFADAYAGLMRGKLGLTMVQPGDTELVLDTLQILQASVVDYTRFFRRLCDFNTAASERNDSLRDLFIDPSSFDAWAKNYRARLIIEQSVDDERSVRMKRVNPKYILRNHLAQQTIEKAQTGDYEEIKVLLEVLQRPFNEQPEMERFALPPTEGSKRVVVSCSS